MKILITIWGPEYGCLYREIEIVKELLRQKHTVKFLIHKSHARIIESHFGREAILRCFDWTIIRYKENNDMDSARTFLSYLNFWLMEALSDFKKFKKETREFNPDIIITDFIPHVIVFSRILKLKCVGVFNYSLDKLDIKLSFSQKIIQRISLYIFSYLYSLNSLNIIETFGNKKIFSKNVIFIDPIAVIKKKDRKNLLEKLDIKNDQFLVFYSLGGSFDNFRNLFWLDKKIVNGQNIKVFVLARSREELIFLKERLTNILVVNDITDNPGDYIYHADLIITKCGFRTVADGLKNQCLLLPLHTPNHPEIFETETLLKKNNLITDVVVGMDNKIIDKIKNALGGKDILENYNKIKFCDLGLLVGRLNKLSENDEA